MAVVIVTAFILSKGQDEDGASPKAFKRIMIITCIVCGLILPENYSTGNAALRNGLPDDVHRAGICQETADTGRRNCGIRNSLCRLPAGHTRQDIGKYTDGAPLHHCKIPYCRLYQQGGSSCRQNSTSTGDGQVAHARIAVATSNVVGKGRELRTA